MNIAKRRLELAAAIISIVGSSLLALSTLILFTTAGLISEVIQPILGEVDLDGISYITGLIKIIIFCMFLVDVLMIVLSSLLCTSPLKNGVIRKRLGISITLLVLLGLSALLYISDFFTFILMATPFGLLLASVCMKHRYTVTPSRESLLFVDSNAETSTASENVNENNSGVVSDAETSNEVEKEGSTSKSNDEVSFNELQSQLAKLKDLKDAGLIDESQYKEAVNKIISKL